MCGIVGYLGKKEACSLIMEGLKALEYRGYDSSGIALLNNSELNIYKKKGKVNDLEKSLTGKDLSGSIGIGHTRWATHGKATDQNAHPHDSGSGNLAIIHNGIIENYKVLKEELTSRGHLFKSDTDSEVLVHLIEEIKIENACPLEKAVQQALLRVEGAYAIIVMSKDDPEKLVAARKGSPLAIGFSQDQYFIASDILAMGGVVDRVIYLEDEEIAVCRSEKDIKIKTIEDIPVTPHIESLDSSIDIRDKMGYDHYMLKEIFEQPKSIEDCLRGRLNLKENEINLSSIDQHMDKFLNVRRIIIISCGTSWHAGLVGEYLFEKYAKISVEVEYASEFRYRDPIINKDDIVIAISQSGETADTLAALSMAKEAGAFTFGICNVVGSSIDRVTDAGLHTRAGAEIGVASTKAFTTQITVLSLMALKLAIEKNLINCEDRQLFLAELGELPNTVAKAMDCKLLTETIAEKLLHAQDILYLGRNINFPIALEGALKMKELSYIHAEGYPAAEMKHGPIALLDQDLPVVVIANNKENRSKIISNIQEVKSRNAQVIAITHEGDNSLNDLCDYVIPVPDVPDFLSPFVSVIPLQFLSYHLAHKLGKDVDQPRNLAKSVTVE
ncbi:MAG: glutamine--fructose-6-phosphate transaminase (isomerizing) [Bacteroidota bacterium]